MKRLACTLAIIAGAAMPVQPLVAQAAVNRATEGTGVEANQDAAGQTSNKTAEDQAYSAFVAQPTLKSAVRYLEAFRTGTHAPAVATWIRSQPGSFSIPESQLVLSLVSQRTIASLQVPTGIATLRGSGLGGPGLEPEMKTYGPPAKHQLLVIRVQIINLGASLKIRPDDFAVMSTAGTAYPNLTGNGTRYPGQTELDEVLEKFSPSVGRVDIEYNSIFAVPAQNLDKFTLMLYGKRVATLGELRRK